jgi:hypothetical protein
MRQRVSGLRLLFPTGLVNEGPGDLAGGSSGRVEARELARQWVQDQIPAEPDKMRDWMIDAAKAYGVAIPETHAAVIREQHARQREKRLAELRAEMAKVAEVHGGGVEE